MGDEIDLYEMVHCTGSTTPDSERKHCAECGSLNIEPAGTSYVGKREESYYCHTCTEYVEACQDTLRRCSHR